MKNTLKTLAALGLALLAPASMLAQAQAQSTVAGGAATARIIVKYKADSTLLRRQAQSVVPKPADQAQALGARIGVPLSAGRAVSERSHVLFARGMSSEALAARVAQEADVEYAVPDRLKRRTAVPNDPLFTTGGANGPAVGQWYLKAPTVSVPASINATAAWDLTIGSNSVVVAVLDTGVRFDHPDLLKVPQGGNLLDGYDMIHDVATANDGGARDPDASDPGDFLTQADIDSGAFSGACTAADIGNSSWHGTQTAGLIGALTDNGLGMASVGRNVRILPVRVLGKCGGFDSDIIAGMRWAVGLSTGDTLGAVPTNTNPARVINMSLGGAGACSPAYTDAVAAVNAAGAVVVASAGNSTGHEVSEPANCPGVIGVAGLRHVGTKTGFSDIGPEVSISAPGGNCVNTTGACLFPIPTTSNSGSTTPVAGAAGAIYTGGGANASIGTSFSAPLVAGTAALMFSSNASLTPAQVLSALKSTSRAFPTAAGIPACTVPTATSADQDECNCTNSTCGAGMLDVRAAVASVAVLQSHVSHTPAAPTPGATVTMSSAQSSAASGRTITSRQWSLVDPGTTGAVMTVAADGLTATVTTTAEGTFTVGLTVTDDNGASNASSQAVGVAVAAAPPSSGGGGGALGVGWLMLLLSAVLALARRPALRRARVRG